MLLATIKLVAGIIILTYGANKFIDATMALAKRFNVPPLLAGVILIGFGTSVPEIIVSSTAAFKGTINIAIGNAIGSNTANIGLVLGSTGLLRALSMQPALLKREFTLLWLVILLVGIFLFNHHLARWEGGVILLALVVYLALIIWLTKRQKAPAEPVETVDVMAHKATWLVAILWLVGLGLMLVGAELMVSGAVAIAEALNISDLVIGLTIVAVGTALPELAASITSAIKGHDALVFGNVIGSNVFNTLAVIGVPALIAPGPLPSALFERDFLVMVCFTALLWVFAWIQRRRLKFARWQAACLLGCYIAYSVYLYL